MRGAGIRSKTKHHWRYFGPLHTVCTTFPMSLRGTGQRARATLSTACTHEVTERSACEGFTITVFSCTSSGSKVRLHIKGAICQIWQIAPLILTACSLSATNIQQVCGAGSWLLVRTVTSPLNHHLCFDWCEWGPSTLKTTSTSGACVITF